MVMKKITEENVKKTYEKYAPIYDVLFGRVLEPGRRRLCELVGERQPTRLLEIGVGTGLTLFNYPDKTSVVGIDLSADMLEQAKSKMGALRSKQIELLAMDAENLDFDDASFDCVTVPYVLSVTPDPQKLVNELRRVCKPGGDIFILNHFSGERFWWLLEKMASSIAARVGFRSQFLFSEQIEVYDWTIVSVEPVNLMNLSKLVHIKNAQQAR
jgi:phosphatidylethanolamine/phosphatidyl-N-methylethanolamine N-methyltransferase